MDNPALPLIPRLFAAWVGWVSRRAAVVLVAAGLATMAAGWYAVTHFSINTDTEDMLSPDLPFLRRSEEISRAFPQFSDNAVIVIESAVADLVDDAARRLVERLRDRPDVFGDVFYPPIDPFFRRNGLLFLDAEEIADLADRLAEAQPFLGTLWQDTTLRGLAAMMGKAVDAAIEDPLTALAELARVFDAIADVAEAQAAGRFGLFSWQEMMAGQSLSAGDRRRLIVIQPRLDFGSLEPAAAMLDAVRDLAGALSLDADHGVRVRITGSAALAHEELRSVEQNMGYASLASLAMVVALLFWGFRSACHGLATMVTLLAGLIWTAAFAFLAVGRLNLISVAFAVLFIGLSVDFGIHYGLRHLERLKAATGGAAALAASAADVGAALLLCAVAAAIGFFSFLPTDYIGLAELGLIAGVGMFIALFANLTLLPAMIALLGGGATRSATARSTSRARRAVAIARPRAVLAVTGLLMVGAAALAPLARFDFDPLHLKDPTTESVSTLFDLMQDGKTSPYAITILAPDLPAAEALGRRLATLPEVDGASTLADYVPSGQDDKLAIIADMSLYLEPMFSGQRNAMPYAADDRATAFATLRAALGRLAREGEEDMRLSAAGALAMLAQLAPGEAIPSNATLAEFERRMLALFEGRMEALRESLRAAPVTLADLPAAIRDREVTADGRARLRVYPRQNLVDRAALVRFVETVRAIAPEASGSPVTILEAGRTVVAAFVEAAVIAVIAIGILLIALLRRPFDVALAFAPLVLAGLFLVAFTVIADLPFNFANLIVLPLLFGLGVANGVHLLWRTRQEGGVERALASTTPRAVVFSALTTVASFGTLAASSHPGTASMGILLTVALILTLVGSLVVLPALLVVARRGTVRRAP